MLNLKSVIKATPFYTLLKSLWRSYLITSGKYHHIQVATPSKKYPLLHLGTEYGGWTFVDDESLNKSVIISAGLGEDASFDVEFAERYESKVIIVDPTPRAITHFNEIMSSLGSRRKNDYSEGGKQELSSYELANVEPSQLVLIKKALWNKKGKIKFYRPKNKAHVSHSIANYQHGYSEDTDFIEVDADTVSTIVEEQGLTTKDINLIKLDIEGAEIEVISQMMEEDFCPKQILVEFDELNAPSRKAVDRVYEIHNLLESNGYVLLHTDGRTDFLYFRERST